MRMRKPKDMDEIIRDCPYFYNENYFNNDNKICLEIGMGKGDFIIKIAQDNPNTNYIGIEKYSSVICHAIKKLSLLENKITNLALLNIDVQNISDYLYNKVDTIYLNFSDPWPKKRNTKRRLTSLEFLKLYDNLFKGDAHIILKTDNDSFFEFSKESLLSYGYKIVKESYDLHKENIYSPETEYEHKFSSLGVKIKYLEVFKEK